MAKKRTRQSKGRQSESPDPKPAAEAAAEDAVVSLGEGLILEEAPTNNLPVALTRKPKSLPEIAEFYFQYFKPLYFDVTTDGEYPAEVHYEIAAAFEHVARFYAGEDPEDYAVLKAHSHIKRACLDLFRIVLRDTKALYDQLMEIDTSAIDNGEFDRKLIALWAETKRLAREAKTSEGSKRDLTPEEVFRAFDKWVPVYDNCNAIEQDFYENPAVGWAKKRSLWQRTPIWTKLGVLFGAIIATAAVMNIIHLLQQWFGDGGG